ncbi:sulfite oxidase [Mycobacterium noviomagense]|uniref:Sulfite oxidase n=1 Tax=Mycobacterium noviomagense TaxID=459858 RepID=A0A7I7P930_9MYCO|nr:sulfite oxidase [Mycobacterium noviomagense]ORB18292.1 sulfite oxidase [Mycobacterium noviomagense]BBY05082.1 sulfite oxidase [Mycobacterium noviomagense]
MWGKSPAMIVHTRSPFNAEPRGSALARNEVTPVDIFYCRNHGPVPEIPVHAWRLEVDGLVTSPLSLSLPALQSRFDIHTVIATLQCAGNRRSGFNEIRAIVDEDLWGSGAISTAEWSGVRLADVLAVAGAGRDDDVHVAFTGPDVSPLAVPAQQFGGSIPLAKAMSGEVLLAWEMNGQALPRIHGGPVRVVVPGYIGARSVKWVNAVTVQKGPSQNYFQSVAYRVLPADSDLHTAGPLAGRSLSSVALNCDILVPADGTEVAAGPLEIRGYALAGEGAGVARVEVSLDQGNSWRQAELAAARSPWAWRHWSLTVEPEPGPLTVTARAWDTTGATQPESAEVLWNPRGYANNSWARVHVAVTHPGTAALK